MSEPTSTTTAATTCTYSKFEPADPDQFKSSAIEKISIRLSERPTQFIVNNDLFQATCTISIKPQIALRQGIPTIEKDIATIQCTVQTAEGLELSFTHDQEFSRTRTQLPQLPKNLFIANDGTSWPTIGLATSSLYYLSSPKCE